MKKKLLTGLMAVVLTLTSFNLMPVNAATAAKTTTATISVYNGGFTLKPTSIKVSADLDDKYADYIGYSDDTENPTMLDALIAAHINLYGEDFTKDHGLLVPGGWISKIVGIDTSAVGYYLNGATSETNANGETVYYGMTTELKANSKVEFDLYSDVTYWSDVYTAFESSEIVSSVGKVAKVTLKAMGYDENWAPTMVPAAGVSIKCNGVDVGTTDENGQMQIPCVNVGTMELEATGTYNGCPIFGAYANVTVKDNQSISISSAKTKSYKYSKTKSRSFNIKVKGAKTSLVYSSSSKKITVSKNGKVTVAKGTKAGTYTVSVYAKASTKYMKSATKKITIKITK